jgi:transposase
MALGRQRGEKQDALWVEAWKLTSGPAHPFYGKLEELLTKNGFDRFVEGLCEKFYAPKMGRPGVIPGVYFRMLFIGYFEGFASEREIAWRCADSLSLRRFLDVPFEKNTPDHSSLSRTRQRIDLETHAEVFSWVLKVVAEHGLVTGKTIGVDGTTLEANAALRSIVRRDTEQGYREFLEDLVKESGIETPTRADIAKVDKKRKGKGSNDDWKHPHDGDAGITKMKDGRTHLAHKAEHSVDLDTGAVLAVTLHRGEAGDTYTIAPTLERTTEELKKLEDDGLIGERETREIVTDKGYHSNDTLVETTNAGWRTYCSEPKQKKRDWTDKHEARDATYANRRRVRGERGKRLLRKRGELLERPFAHYLDGGGMRRTHLRTHPKIMKRLLAHVAGFNLGLILRKVIGHGTPRALAASASSILCYLRVTFTVVAEVAGSMWSSRNARDRERNARSRAGYSLRMASATGC